MKRIYLKKLFLERITAITLMVFVVGGSAPITAFAALSVDITADGQSSLTLSGPTADFDILVNATDATSCQVDAGSFSSGIAPGSSMNISPSHPAYPSAGGSTTFTATCLDATGASLSDSVTVSLASASTTPTVDVEANGSDGPITINNGDTYTLSWTSTNATACQMNPPVISGVTLSGSTTAIGPGSPFYPAAGSSVTVTVDCTDGTNTASDSVVINVASTGGGGGGGTNPTADIDANGSDGPITINSGDTYTLSWTSTNATACTMNPPVVSGISLSGTSVPISSGSPFYPTTTSPVTVTISCTDGTNTATDSVVINLASSGGGGGGSSPSVDVKANGSDGPVTLDVGETYVYTWTSANATACTMTSPVTSGVSLSGTSVTIDSANTSFYPTLSSSVTITISCTDSDGDTATDSVVINLEDEDNGGGGGGGGGGGRNRSSRGSVLAGSVECPWIHDYMRADFQNDPTEVMKLQAFLKVFMGYDYVTINGVFDAATVQAVGAFQMLYASEILTPWGHTAPTYYVYILTLKKVNELYCQEILPLTTEQANEIVTFRSLVNQARQLGVPTSFTEDAVVPAELKEGAPVQLPIVGVGGKGQNVQALAAALFTFPDNLKDTMQCLYEFALILIVLYILGSVLKDVLYQNTPENTLKRFLAKWAAITLGLVAAMLGAFALGELCLMSPLLLATLFSLIWMSFYPKHGSIRASAKAWYMVASARSKSLIKGKPKTGDSLSQSN